MAGNVYNIPASCSFVDSLACRFGSLYKDKPAELAEVLFLLPNRRACSSLRDAFVRFNGLNPAILPQIVPIGEMDEDELYFSTFSQTEILENIPPSISDFERLFLFTKLIVSKPEQYGLKQVNLAQALVLAQDLAKFIDVCYNEQLSFAKLTDIVPGQYASHWQDTLAFLKIITEYWPEILRERGLIDKVKRKNMLLGLQADIWQQNPPHKKIVAAGITAVFPGMQKILNVIKNLPLGELYFYGIDKILENEAWELLDESHPQYEIREMLKLLDLQREDVANIDFPLNPAREAFVTEIMRPAESTGKWRSLNIQDSISSALQNLHTVKCKDLREEALAIALIMRETLNIPGKTAALVTADRGLARRVAAELERWDVKIDDSAGKPLHLTPVAIFLRLIVLAVKENFADSVILALAKSPYARLGFPVSELRKLVRAWELGKRTPHFDGLKEELPLQETPWLCRLKQGMAEFIELFKLKAVPFKHMLLKHLQAAEFIACEAEQGEAKSGADLIWRGDDGRAAANLFSSLLLYSDTLGTISPSDYAGILEILMSKETIRPVYGTHPRLKILGLIEARYNHYDTVIIGGLNEGVWPQLPSSDPWLSRPMKKEFGMSLPEKNIGICASDFTHLMCSPEVYITRSERAEGTPANKSRWMLRLETVLKAYGYKSDILENQKYNFLTGFMDKPHRSEKIEAPSPCPPLYARPRCLSASAIEKLMRDPYEIFAEKILRLKPLDNLDKHIQPSDYGNFVHKVLEQFNKSYPGELPADAYEILCKLGEEFLNQSRVPSEVKAFWRPAFEKTAEWIINLEKNYRCAIDTVYSEVCGEIQLDAPGGTFTIQARADRVDLNKNGTLNIIDYKTGEPRTPKEVAAGYAPQLPIEGLIAEAGGFRNGEKMLAAAPVEKLFYWKLGEKSVEYSKEMKELLHKTHENLTALISAFDSADTPYLARPNPRRLLKYSDYEHLARVKEWSAGGSDGE